MPKLEKDEQSSVTQAYHRRGLGVKFPATGQIFVIKKKKKAILMPLDHITLILK